MTHQALFDIPVKLIDGSPASLADYKGQVILVVNVASQCGLTPQYTGLEKLFEANSDRGFVVLGFPANDFGSQEPGSNSEIAQFCVANYGVQFPMFEKITVKGEDRHPLYNALIEAQPRAKGAVATSGPDDISWNFEKFLIARSGEVVARFSPAMTPEDPVFVNAIETEIAR